MLVSCVALRCVAAHNENSIKAIMMNDVMDGIEIIM